MESCAAFSLVDGTEQKPLRTNGRKMKENTQKSCAFSFQLISLWLFTLKIELYVPLLCCLRIYSHCISLLRSTKLVFTCTSSSFIHRLQCSPTRRRLQTVHTLWMTKHISLQFAVKFQLNFFVVHWIFMGFSLSDVKVAKAALTMNNTI